MAELQGWISLLLVAVLAIITGYYARQAAKTVDELREARLATFLPMPKWERLLAYANRSESEGRVGPVYYGVDLHLLNIGPGPARLLSGSVSCDTAEQFDLLSLQTPSTLPSGKEERVTISRQSAVFEERRRTFTVKVRYADLQGLRVYETRALIDAYLRLRPQDSQARFIDSDERSVEERRVS